MDDSSSSSEGEPSPEPIDVLAAAVCDRNERCYDYVQFPNNESCLAHKGGFAIPLPLSGIGTPTPAQLTACAARYQALKGCDGLLLFPECQFPGTKENGKPCLLGQQCAGGACVPIDGDQECGACAQAA